MKKRFVAFLLVLIMVLGMLPVSALAADETFTLGNTSLSDATLETATPSPYINAHALSGGSASKKVNESGFWQRLPRYSFIYPNMQIDYTPVNYAIPANGVQVSKEGVIGDCKFTLVYSSFYGYTNVPALQFNYTAKTTGTTNVTLTYFYNYGLITNYGVPVDTNWYRDTVTFTISVGDGEIQSPNQPTERDVNGVTVDVVCVTTTGKHDEVATYPLGHGTNQYTIGEVERDGKGGYICPVTVQTEWFVQRASEKVWNVQHTPTEQTITFNLTYDKNSKTWVKPAANPRIEATHKVTPPIDKPNKPGAGDYDVDHATVKVQCVQPETVVKHNDSQNAFATTLYGYAYTIGDVTQGEYNGENRYYVECTVTESVTTFVNTFNVLYKGHTEANNPAHIRTFKLWYFPENKEAGKGIWKQDGIPTFYVKCEAAPKKPAALDGSFAIV